MTQRKLFFVDDDPGVREFFLEVVERSFPNLDVLTASNGQEAYEKIREQRPDIMYTDVRMPIMSGDALLERLLEDINLDPTKKPIPTIIISGGGLNTEENRKAVELANRMYTSAQLERISSYKPPLGRDGKPLPYEGFTYLPKPFNIGDLVGRTRLLLDIL